MTETVAANTQGPRLYVHLRESGDVLSRAIKQVAFGARAVDDLVSADGEEAKVAVVNVAAEALRALKETQHTQVIIFIFTNEEARIAHALRERFPERITVASVIGGDGNKNLLIALLDALYPKEQKGVGDHENTPRG